MADHQGVLRVALEQRLDIAMAVLEDAMRRLTQVEAAVAARGPSGPPPPPIPRPLGPDVPIRLNLGGPVGDSWALLWGDACFAQREFIVKALRAIPPGTRIPINATHHPGQAAKIMLNWIIDLIESGDYPHA